MSDKKGFHLVLAVIALAVVMAVAYRTAPARPLTAASPQSEKKGLVKRKQASFSYTDLIAAARDGNVARVVLNTGPGVAEVRMKSQKLHTVSYPPQDADLPQMLARSGAQVTVKNDQPEEKGGRPVWVAALQIIVMLSLLGFLMFMFRRSGKGSMPGMPTPARTTMSSQVAERPDVTFADVAGCDEAVTELQEIAGGLTHRDLYLKVGAKLPSGVMLYGPPGTGKTLLARALAGETGRAFFSVSGSEFVEMFVGVGASRVRNLFRQARQQPSIVFIDEIDAIGKRRGQGSNNDEREQTLNQILVEMDGFSSRDDVIVLAGTNMLETLDPALLRPGRFSLHVEVGLPNEEGRQAILAVHARGKRLASGTDLAAIAAMTYGMSGAQLEELLNQAALMCARSGRDEITQTDLREGYMRVLMGPEKSGQVATAEERRVVAWHEAGHAVCGQLLPTQDNPQFVSIRQRGKALGVAVYGQTDRGLHSTRFLHEQLMCVLGGRAAEFVQFGTVSSGAANDLQKANAIARSAVEQLGLSADVGQIISEGATLSEQTRNGIDREVTRMISDAYADAVTLLRAHRRELDELSELLLSAETVERQELELVIGVAGTSSHTPDVQLGPQVTSRSTTAETGAPVAVRRTWRDRRVVALATAAAHEVRRRRSQRRPSGAV